MRAWWRSAGIAILFSSLSALMGVTQNTKLSNSVAGSWDASLTSHGVVIPFRLDIAGSGPDLKGIFYDGFRPYEGTTSATFQDGELVLKAEHYLTTITATLKDGQLVGNMVSQSRDSTAEYAFRATRHVGGANMAAAVPAIAGSWIIPLDIPSSKGEKAFRLIVEQRGAEVAASILRVDGDTGAYSGTFKDGKWVLSHFDGSRPGVIEVADKRARWSINLSILAIFVKQRTYKTNGHLASYLTILPRHLKMDWYRKAIISRPLRQVQGGLCGTGSRAPAGTPGSIRF